MEEQEALRLSCSFFIFANVNFEKFKYFGEKFVILNEV